MPRELPGISGTPGPPRPGIGIPRLSPAASASDQRLGLDWSGGRIEPVATGCRWIGLHARSWTKARSHAGSLAARWPHRTRTEPQHHHVRHFDPSAGVTRVLAYGIRRQATVWKRWVALRQYAMRPGRFLPVCFWGWRAGFGSSVQVRTWAHYKVIAPRHPKTTAARLI